MLPVSMRPAPFSVVEEGWPLSEQIAKTAALHIECRDCRHKNALHCQVSLTVAGWFSFSNHTLCLGSTVCCLLGVNSISIAGVQQLLGKRNSGNVTVHYTNSKNGYTKWFRCVRCIRLIGPICTVPGNHSLGTVGTRPSEGTRAEPGCERPPGNRD